MSCNHRQTAKLAELASLFNELCWNCGRNRDGTRRNLPRGRFRSVPTRFRSLVPFYVIENEEEFRWLCYSSMLIEDAEDYARGMPCPDEGHDFELLEVSCRFAILAGHSRCRFCGTLADDFKVVSQGQMIASAGLEGNCVGESPRCERISPGSKPYDPGEIERPTRDRDSTGGSAS